MMSAGQKSSPVERFLGARSGRTVLAMVARVAAIVAVGVLLAGCSDKPELDDRDACQQWSSIRPGASGADPAEYLDRLSDLAGRTKGAKLNYLLNGAYVAAETGGSRDALRAMTKVDSYCGRR